MGRPKTEVVDEDGNVLPPPEPGSDLAHAIYLIEYGRKRGFRIGPTVQIGAITFNVLDLRQVAATTKAQKSEGDLDPESDMAVLLSP